MEWHQLIGIIAGAIAVGAMVPYVLSVIKGDTRPNIVSWSLWTVIVLLTLTAQISAGASWSMFLLIGSAIGNFTVVMLCICGYGYKKFAPIDQITLGIVLIAILLWWFTTNPATAIIFTVTADGVAYIPTFEKVYREPKSENLFYWTTLVLADVLALGSVTMFTTANMLFPIAYGIFNGLVPLIAFSRSKLWLKRST